MALKKSVYNKLLITGLLTVFLVFLICPAAYAGHMENAERINIAPNIILEIDIDSGFFFLFKSWRLTIETDSSVYVFSEETVPPVVVRLILSTIRTAVILCVYLIRRAFFEQGAMALKKRPLRVVGNGLVVYVALAGLTIMFIFSVVAAPVAALFFLILIVLSVCGEISAALLLGRYIRPVKKTFSYANLPLGAIIIEGTGCLPYIGWIFRLVLFPIIFIGTAVSCFIDGYINKVFYEFQ